MLPETPDGKKWQKIENELDRKSIPEQLDWLAGAVERAIAELLIGSTLAKKVVIAYKADVLKEKEGESLAAAFERIKDLQAMLVMQWSGHNSDREILEQLHHIYFPQRRPDGGLALSLDDHLLAARRGALEVLAKGAQSGPECEYWKRLGEYAKKHLDEPRGKARKKG